MYPGVGLSMEDIDRVTGSWSGSLANPERWPQQGHEGKEGKGEERGMTAGELRDEYFA